MSPNSFGSPEITRNIKKHRSSSPLPRPISGAHWISKLQLSPCSWWHLRARGGAFHNAGTLTVVDGDRYHLRESMGWSAGLSPSQERQSLGVAHALINATERGSSAPSLCRESPGEQLRAHLRPVSDRSRSCAVTGASFLSNNTGLLIRECISNFKASEVRRAWPHKQTAVRNHGIQHLNGLTCPHRPDGSHTPAAHRIETKCNVKLTFPEPGHRTPLCAGHDTE